MSFLNSINLDAWRVWAPLGIAGIIVWLLWLYRFVSSRFADPVVNDFRTTTSVVVPRYREDPDILISAWPRWLAQDPTEVIVVVDVDDTECQERLDAVEDPRLQTIVFEHRGKRSALGVGIRAAVGEVVVLSDSDTLWTAGLLEAVQMPFVDPRSARWAPSRTSTNARQHLAPDRRLDGRPPVLRLRPGDGPKGCGDLRLRAHRGVSALGRSCPCSRTSSTSSSSDAAAWPATTGGYVAGARRPATRRCTSPRRGRSRCSPTRSGPSASSGSGGAATRRGPT